MVAKTMMTADDLLAMPDDGHRYELIDGELVRMAPADFDSSNDKVAAYGLAAEVPYDFGVGHGLGKRIEIAGAEMSQRQPIGLDQRRVA